MNFSDPSIPGLSIVSEYLSEEEQESLISIIDEQPWQDDLRRRVQHYGYRYDYKRKTIDASMKLGPLPSWALDLAGRLRDDGHTCHTPDQVIVNEYLPGQGISPHVDCKPCFTETILSLSLGSTCILTLTHLTRKTAVDLFLEPGSLLVLSGEARYDWKHGIAQRKKDVHAGCTIARARRISLTFRSVITQPAPS